MGKHERLVPAAATGAAGPSRRTLGRAAFRPLAAILALAAAYIAAGVAHPAEGAPGASGRAAAHARPPAAAGGPVRPKPGTVAVTAAPGARAPGSVCRRTYHARGLVVATGGFAVYHWRLLRWSPAVKRWRPYLAARPAFTGDTRTVHWRPQIVANPGWYRVELRVRPGGTAYSKGFRVTC